MLYLRCAMNRTQPPRLRKKSDSLLEPVAAGEGDDGWSAFFAARRSRLRKLRVVRRLVSIVLWTLVCFPVQGLLLVLPGRLDAWFSRVYWGGVCRLFGVEIRVIGAAAHRDADGRPVVYVSTHSSWLDVAVLGATLDACFIAKEEVRKWPVISWIARLGRTVYVRRKRTSTARERDEMRLRLAAGDNLILFPEGTTSDGARVMPFRSAFLSIAEVPVLADGRTARVQPVSLVYDRISGLPAGRASRTLFAWIGDMDLASHFGRLAQEHGMRASVLLHAPLDPAAYRSRKELTEAVWRIAADGAATLRQNRPAVPLGLLPGAEPAPA